MNDQNETAQLRFLEETAIRLDDICSGERNFRISDVK